MRCVSLALPLYWGSFCFDDEVARSRAAIARASSPSWSGFATNTLKPLCCQRVLSWSIDRAASCALTGDVQPVSSTVTGHAADLHPLHGGLAADPVAVHRSETACATDRIESIVSRPAAERDVVHGTDVASTVDGRRARSPSRSRRWTCARSDHRPRAALDAAHRRGRHGAAARAIAEHARRPGCCRSPQACRAALGLGLVRVVE